MINHSNWAGAFACKHRAHAHGNKRYAFFMRIILRVPKKVDFFFNIYLQKNLSRITKVNLAYGVAIEILCNVLL